jgi:hypothetical protein
MITGRLEATLIPLMTPILLTTKIYLPKALIKFIWRKGDKLHPYLCPLKV